MSSGAKSNVINISDFKARALQLIAEIAKKGKEYVITKKGIPVARVTPFRRRHGPHLGSLQGMIEIQSDIVHYDSSSEWELLKK